MVLCHNTAIYTADKIFTGESWLYDYAVMVNAGIITQVLPQEKLLLPATQHAHTLLPACIDIQVYGAAGRLFSVYPDSVTLQHMYAHGAASGTGYFMPTIATVDEATMLSAIDAVKDYWRNNGKGCLGLHIEGPWINTAKRGAHDPAYIHSPEYYEVKNLLEHGKGIIKIITLAPEVCSAAIITLIQSYGVMVFAGHSNATYTQAMQAFNNGIHHVTHLYNAMSGLHHRQPGLVGATLQHPQVFASIIADGYHVDYAAISIAKRLMDNRLFVITDATTHNTQGFYQHQFNGDHYTSNGVLSGSALTMVKAVDNLVKHAGLGFDEAWRMCSTYVAHALGLQQHLGKIATGYSGTLYAYS
jgi:N-acetylglucosamine-6-phosphate deacetylase